MFGLDPWLTFLLILCLSSAFIFEFINGFHDTANAVATVIYTHSLKPVYAVIWSGIWNFIGVYVGGIAVAMGIVKLLPMEILVDQNVYHSIAMVLALVMTAVIWNLGTWYLGLPCSSSHTLIGSIFGVGLAFMLLPGNEGVALNWAKVKDVGLSLMISPVVGFGLALFLMLLLKRFIKNESLFHEPEPGKPPPRLIRSILILTSTSLSFSHGSNDGQKGVGLMMIILISIVPTFFAIDQSQHPKVLLQDVITAQQSISIVDTTKLEPIEMATFKVFSTSLANIKGMLMNVNDFHQLNADQSIAIRKNILLMSKKTDDFYDELNHLRKKDKIITTAQIHNIKKEITHLKKYTEYAPWWVIVMISISLGLGTMIGWKRIVVTVGEKIGKSHITYAQGMAAELVAAISIQFSTQFGLPVSTTHVLSSGVAGTMVAGKGLKNLRKKTVKNIAIAWLITLPFTILVSGGLFLLLRYFLK